MSTYIRYGDMEIFNCLTRSFEQKAVLDDSDTDLIFFEFTIRVVGWLTDESFGSVGMRPASFQGNPAEQHKLTRREIEPRHAFQMKVGTTGSTGAGGTMLLEVDPANQSTRGRTDGIDVNNGPRAAVYSLTQITGNEVFRAEVEFTICLACEQSRNYSGILSNRWTCIDDVGPNRELQRTWQGRLRVAHAHFNPNTFRPQVMPILQPGMKRERMQFAVSPDGLNLDYQIIDRESFYAAPEPATSWEYEHEVTTADALHTTEKISVRLDAPRDVDKRNLVTRAASFIEGKLIRPNNAVNLDPQILEMSFIDHGGDYQNAITARAHILVNNQGDPKALSSFALVGKPVLPEDFVGALGQLTLTGYDRNYSRNVADTPEVSGPIGFAAALSAHLQSPCELNHGTGQGVPVTELAPPSIQTVITNAPPLQGAFSGSTSSSYLSPEYNRSRYHSFRLESKYEVQTMKVAMPIAKSSSSNAPNTAIVSLAPAQCIRRLRIRGERINQWPKLPEALQTYQDVNGIRADLIEAKAKPNAPTRSADGTQVYSIDAEYVYALERPPTSSERLLVGIIPWDNTGMRYTDYDTFKDRIA